MFNKKGDAGLTAVVIIILIIVFLGWLVNLGNRQCNSNADCGKESYCGVDHGCHKIPVIEKSTVVVQRDYTGAAKIIGAAIVIASIFFNFDKIRPRRKQKQDQWGQVYY
ncbi:hypothetical protein ACFLZ6_01685 [Nanoarchaeota archaeon]